MKHVKLFESFEGIQKEIDDLLINSEGAWDTVRRLQGLEDKYDHNLSSDDQELVIQAYNTVYPELKSKQVNMIEKRKEDIHLLKSYKSGKMTASNVLYALGLDKDPTIYDL
jgi:hypothetical protein